jgi:hypothetical protein
MSLKQHAFNAFAALLALFTSGILSPASAQYPPMGAFPETAWHQGYQDLSPHSMEGPDSQWDFEPLAQAQEGLRPLPSDGAEEPPLASEAESDESEFDTAATATDVTNSQNVFGGNEPVQDLTRLMPGNFANTKYRWYGFVRLDGIFDFNPIGSTDDFVTSSIPVPQGRGQNAVLTPRYTRLGFDTETPWECMGWDIKTRIEMDFFNGNTSGVFGSFPLRLRFAWVDFGPFLIGQAASLFMDYDVFPNVIDYEGPPGMVLMRQPIVAIRLPFGCWRVAGAIEHPYSDIQWFDGVNWIVNPGTGIITQPGVDRNIQDMPDFTGNIRGESDYAHFQVAGIARKLTFQPAVGPDLNEFGYGINVTGTWHPWACLMGGCGKGDEMSPLEKSRFLGQYATGKGITRYIQDVNGFGLDATFDPLNGFQLIPATGWFAAYEQWWADNWISTFCYGEAECDLTDTLPDNTYDAASYATVNLIWLPVERMGTGIEYLYGTRENKDGQRGTAHRIQFGFQYRF